MENRALPAALIEAKDQKEGVRINQIKGPTKAIEEEGRSNDVIELIATADLELWRSPCFMGVPEAFQSADL